MTGIIPPTEKIRILYRKSQYRAGPVKTAIGRLPDNIPVSLKSRNLVMLSAYNPGGRMKALGWNQRMMRNLRQYLNRYEYFEGKGELHGSSEPLYMVVADPRKMKVLARKFRQNAIVIIKDQQPSRLVYLA